MAICQHNTQHAVMHAPDEVGVDGKVLDRAVEEEIVHEAKSAVGQIVQHRQHVRRVVRETIAAERPRAGW